MLSSFTIIVRIVNSSRVRWAGYVARKGGEIEMHTEFWWGNLDKRHYCGKLGIDCCCDCQLRSGEMGWLCGTQRGGNRNAYRVLVGKPG